MLSAKHGGGVVRKPTNIGPRLETLLDERDHLRIKISMAEDNPDTLPEAMKVFRQALFELDRRILKHWEEPDA